ncbi:hypothetical protein BJY04DRAFT_197160 [Aspergillus karnatakaensis]|uniref:fungal specific transcription factor domain-containing protein n=1 Tax=Aspergillus karnatakaensis TaxID=1810916 RepID=UPI003CCDDCC1
MTYWHETPEDPKDFRHWLEIALSQAAMIAFPDADRWSNDTTTSGLWKRIWWCMYTRDRLVALNLRRHTVISDEEFTVPLPTLADFDIQQYPERVIRMLGGCAILSHLEQQEQLAQMFIEKCKLCRVLSDIVAPVSDNSMPATTYHSTALVKWHSDLPSDIHYQEPPSQPLSEGERALFAYRAWLKMLYLTASRAQHRQNPQSSMPSPNSPEASLQSLTNSIASIAEGLHQHDLIHCLPTTTVGLLMPVLATHFMNIRSETPDLWQNAFQSLYQCLKALEKLGEVYALAESMATFFQSAICGDEIKLSANGGIEKDFLERVLTPGEMQGFEDLVRQERSLVK